MNVNTNVREMRNVRHDDDGSSTETVVSRSVHVSLRMHLMSHPRFSLSEAREGEIPDSGLWILGFKRKTDCRGDGLMDGFTEDGAYDSIRCDTIRYG